MQARLLSILLFSCFLLTSPSLPGKVVTGAEQTHRYLPQLRGKRVALVVNQTSVVGETQTHLLDTLLAQGIGVQKIFAPEHGFRGKADAGETIRNGRDSRTGLPIFSLYGKNKKPTAEQLQDVEWVVFDIQDVGARFYTYISTLFYVMEACAENGKQVMVLDRPNPCDYIDGPVLQPAFRSFVGMLPIPLLHGCTLGEMARMINGEGWLNSSPKTCRLTVVPVLGWKHGETYSLPIKPSPNLPNDTAIQWYASLCPFEATRISVGRGTTFPFQVLGAPDVRYGRFTFTPRSLPGFDKNPLHKNIRCHGIDLREMTPPQGFTLQYVLDFYRRSAQGAAFFSRPRWMDLLMGTDAVRKAIVAGQTEQQIRASWQPALRHYRAKRARYVLYE